MVTVSKHGLERHTAALFAELDVLKGPAMRQTLARDPISVLRAWPEVTVQEVPAAPSAECEVAGAFLASTDPPTLVIAQATSQGRRAFTALHELGHFLQAMSDDLTDALVAQPDGGRALEEASCDAFAAEILIPADTASEHLVDGPTAAGIQRLFGATAASRSAVCVAASRHLLAPGHVMLLDRDGRVVIDAAVGQPRVRRNSDQSSLEVIARARRSPEHRATGRVSVRYRDGITGQELYAQVAELDEYFVVVAMTDHAPWLAFAPTSARPGPSARWWSCEHCPAEFAVWEAPCPRCSTPKCPECDGCGCAPRERMCTDCFMVYGPAMFAGASTVCSQCE